MTEGVRFMATNKSPNRDKKNLNLDEQHFIEMQNHCALCNTALEIKVETYLEDFYLREEAECPTCKIKTRVKNHKMQ